MKRYISILIIFLITASSTFGISTEVEASKKLTRDEARNILISRNLVISIDWCIFPGKCPDKTFYLQNPFGNFFESSDAGIKVSREILSSYLSCLESKNLVRYAGKTRGSEGSFSWDSWLETTSGEPFHLTEIGQKYIDDKSKFVISVNVDKITGIQFREEETVAKVFFDATTKSSDNPFNKCFEDYFDVRSLLNEPYAMFELFDDGWRFKDWNTGGSLKQKDQTSQGNVSPPLGSSLDKKKNSHNIQTFLTPDKDFPFIGFWKTKCENDFGLAIEKTADGKYSVSFCGPGGCFKTRSTTIINDSNYRIIDENTIEQREKSGFQRYYRCKPSSPEVSGVS